MADFLEIEKLSQTKFKTTSSYFSDEARGEGLYRGKPRPFCLPRALAEENLFPDIRQSAVSFFNRHVIKWHDGQDGKPSNHLCSSQVCCVNFLFPLAHEPQALKQILQKIYPHGKKLLPVEDGLFIYFVWISVMIIE